MQLGMERDTLITWGIAGLLACMALAAFFHVWRLRRRARRFRRLVDKLSPHRLHDVIVADDDELDYFEHLVLLPQGIGLIHVLDYGGVIFADEHIDLWTQVVGRKSYRFPNPLEQLRARLGVIRALTDEERVFGWLLFSERASFPKGRPAQLSLGRELLADLGGQRGEPVDEALRTAWQRLCETVTEAPPGMASRSQASSAAGSRAAIAAGLLFVGLAGLWLYWRLAA